MDVYACDGCGYWYDPEAGDEPNGIEPGIPFEDLPHDWVCPDCGAGKEDFYLIPNMDDFEYDDLDDVYVHEQKDEAL